LRAAPDLPRTISGHADGRSAPLSTVASAPATVKKIFCTTIPPRTPGRVAPGMIATNIRSVTKVPMLAGRNPFNASPAAFAASTYG
jgi:hypothetical protein